MKSVAVVGAGPIGLEAALEARRLGLEVVVYEAGAVGEHLRRFGWVRLFTPFRMNSTETGRRRLRESGMVLPGEEELLTASDLVARYLVPLARLPELRGVVREGARVTQIGREGVVKQGRGSVGARVSRAGRKFLLGIEGGGFETADVVLDASGVYGSPNATGPGGLLAEGEDLLGERIERHIPALRAAAGSRFRGRRILLLGAGHSAATVLVELDALAHETPGASPAVVHWITHDLGAPSGRTDQAAPPIPIFREVADDPLPARSDLASRANRVAASAPWLRRHPGAVVERYVPAASAARVTVRMPSGEAREIEADLVLALVGYRPDTALFRELQVHLCYASEGPMALASAILASEKDSLGDAGDCLAQVPHGPESLRNPEPDFYILGAKSYGRNTSFLLTIGHRQIVDAFSLIGGPEPARTAARTSGG